MKPAPVPDLLRGVWRRVSIVEADGTTDTTTSVFWVQLESTMFDMRVPAEIDALADRGSLAGCSFDDLALLARCEASTGFTTCTPIETGEDEIRRATAEWHTRGPGDLALHPITAYPEPGLLEWNDDATVMIERAPSGAYVEEWHRVPGSTDGLESDLEGRRQRYTAGSFIALAHDRRRGLDTTERIDVQLRARAGDLDASRALLDCDFSIAEVVDDFATIIASTHPWMIGVAVA